MKNTLGCAVLGAFLAGLVITVMQGDFRLVALYGVITALSALVGVGVDAYTARKAARKPPGYDPDA